MNTPVVLLIYNRVDTLRQVLDVLRQARPSSLYVVADGPRAGDEEDAERCFAARSVLDGIDWPCRIVTQFAERNMGVGLRVSSGISWAFDQVQEAIIVEDDCLPDPTFFEFCETLLTTYRDDDRIMMISGTNPLGDWKSEQHAYHFSRHGLVWGWATWRRAWQHYDYRMSQWADEASREQLRDDSDQADYERFKTLYADLVNGRVDTWDYQWSFARFLHQGLTIVPAKNLVQNIGFGKEATHTTHHINISAHMPRHEMQFPMKGPQAVAADRAYDETYVQWRDGRPPAWVIAHRAELALQQGQWFHAYLWADAALRDISPLTENDRETLSRLRDDALARRATAQ